MPKPMKPQASLASAVRSRRAYFDCRFGQLHVRTAFPATGGFDEQTTLFCVHPSHASSRVFGGFLAAMADRRSVYAPDLPGCGESDPAPLPGAAAAVAAIGDLARELRLQHIDVLGFLDGCDVAMELAVTAPDLLHRLVLVGATTLDRLASIERPCLVLGAGEAPAAIRARAAALPAHIEFANAPPGGENLPDLEPQALARRCAPFFDRLAKAPHANGAAARR